MTQFAMDQHLADDVLVRIVDREEPAGHHLESCEVCAARLFELRRRSQTLTAMLRATDPAMPVLRAPAVPSRNRLRDRARRPGWLRAAAVLLLLTAVGITAYPARAWILDWIRDTLGWSAEPAAPTTQPSAPGDAGSISFEPAGDDVLIRITDASAGGELRLRSHGDASLVIQAPDARAAGDVLVLPAGVQIARTVAGGAYEVTLPSSIEVLRLQIGDADPIPVDLDRLPCSIPLGGVRSPDARAFDC